ncbi:MAG: bifunctional DNA-formamidopyrimidine glycosylase/DNA-(apurinic or apyrimidinic site) lyase [Chloroflexi bacterium]|nr:bifunctional DNA-formamidopyrimidine glycosylase/DNA-(apurinic or apyrimidinic site) lyase [Chloroflexota bacterium]OJV97108.1 MAG: DNA-formamidopyrimidine glycosylase [Chloroflexi bacterium 54-19]
MPELPEVETTVRDLRQYLPGKTIDKVSLADWPRMIQTHPPEILSQLLAGEQILGLERRAKYIIVNLTNDKYLVFHRKMTGNLFFRQQDAPADKYTHVVIAFTDGTELRFTDLRKFGRVYLFLGKAELDGLLGRLGPEPLLDSFTPQDFQEIMRPRKGNLKVLLLNQDVLVGLGNIYVNEALFVSGLNPQRTAQSLTDGEREKLYHAIRQVLNTGIENRGTTLSDYLDGEGNKGRNQEILFVHNRDKEPCRTCGTTIAKIVVGQRGTYYCPTCQPGESSQ